MFRKVLVANRGEIAVRIIRACRELGVASVLAHSEADRNSLPYYMADETVCIGPPPSDKSYLNIPNIVSAALMTRAEAIHPGYGFLSENAYLAEVCEQCGIAFIGPTASSIEQFSDKAFARERMREVGLPVLRGIDVPLHSLDLASQAAAEVGYPVMIKACAGGGGRGLRPVYDEGELLRDFPVAQMEARNAFGNGELYLEALVEGARHVEVQVLVDRYGNAVHLGERDCSLQRRHQKILEESPCTALTPDDRAAICGSAASAAAAIGYQGAGTLEFLLDREGRHNFIEMNTRIQVEHPVSEMNTGIDLVKWQIRIAAGETLDIRQEDILFRGHAIECRVNAEDPARGFAPRAGTIDRFVSPGGPGIRVDTHLFPGYVMPPYYDSLLAKVIAWGSDRSEAIARMSRALEELEIGGVVTNLPFQLGLLSRPEFVEGRFTTHSVSQWQEARRQEGKADEVAASPAEL